MMIMHWRSAPEQSVDQENYWVGLHSLSEGPEHCSAKVAAAVRRTIESKVEGGTAMWRDGRRVVRSGGSGMSGSESEDGATALMRTDHFLMHLVAHRPAHRQPRRATQLSRGTSSSPGRRLLLQCSFPAYQYDHSSEDEDALKSAVQPVRFSSCLASCVARTAR